jgi:hypothetical protein
MVKKGLIVGDQRTHAAVHKLTGIKALCGGGRISVSLPDRFVPEDRTACSECAELAISNRKLRPTGWKVQVRG